MRQALIRSTSIIAYALLSMLVLEIATMIFGKPTRGVSFGISVACIFLLVSFIAALAIFTSQFKSHRLTKIITFILAAILILTSVMTLNPYGTFFEGLLVATTLVAAFAVIAWHDLRKFIKF